MFADWIAVLFCFQIGDSIPNNHSWVSHYKSHSHDIHTSWHISLPVFTKKSATSEEKGSVPTWTGIHFQP